MQSETIGMRLGDGELLERFSIGGDQPAFEEVVQRYQDMVKRVCRQVIGSNDEAEDASQQVFVALSIKANTLTNRMSVASWLYRVAWNISSKTRRAMRIRKGHENAVGSLSRSSADGSTEPDTRLILQEALADIPEPSREAIVLHYFCGLTTAEAAARLHCPAGTFAARVSRGLELLRSRLSDRDLILSAVAIKVVLLGMIAASRASTVATVPLRGRPPGGAGIRRIPRIRFLKSIPFVGALPALIGNSTLAGNAPGAASTMGGRFGAGIGLKLFLSLAIGISCAGAGVAAKAVAPKLAAKLANIAAALSSPPNSNTGSNPDSNAASDSKATKAQSKEPEPQSSDNSPPSPAATAGSGGPATAIPEPGSVCLLAAVGLTSLGRRPKKFTQM